MENIASRIKELIENEGLTNTEFAKKADINPAIVSHIISGRNKPSLQVVNNIRASFTNVNLDYIITGSGQLYNDFTNVNEDKSESVGPPAPLELDLKDPPVKRHSITDTGPEAPGNDTDKVESKLGETPSRPQEFGSKEIEQIVIFYKDGSFKAYHP